MSYDDPAHRTFTITFKANGDLEEVSIAPGTGTVEPLKPRFDISGQALAVSALAVLRTQENPTCWYFYSGGVAYKICR